MRGLKGNAMAENSDTELQAIEKLISALEPLDQDARTRVIDYVFRRLRMSSRDGGHDLGMLPRMPVATGGSAIPVAPSSPPVTDIRSLKEAKAPQTAHEMAAIVAYYLSELAPSNDRKLEIDASDVKNLFKQALFPMPGSPTMTLVHAKNAGYLDPGSARGTYRLNPVGYNLVVHKLPLSTVQSSATNLGRARKPKRTTKKRGPKKTATNS